MSKRSKIVTFKHSSALSKKSEVGIKATVLKAATLKKSELPRADPLSAVAEIPKKIAAAKSVAAILPSQ